jgi:predicted N-acetyltransferase YhbS
MKIEYLKEHSEWVPTIAAWFHREWGAYHPGLDVDAIAERLRQRLNTDRLPLALVAVDQAEIIGTVSLKEYDMDTRMQYSPWLASLYVVKHSRNKGVGISLIEAGIAEAKSMAMEHLYLYTREKRHVNFYLANGWTLVENSMYRGGAVAILLKAIH